MILVSASFVAVRVESVRAATVDITLYGSAGGITSSPPYGWGNSSSTITEPGPTLTVSQYDFVSLTLFSQDGLGHEFFVDYNNNSLVDPGEPVSPSFSTSIVFGFNATRAGVFTYLCRFYPSIMHGTFVVTPAVPEYSNAVIVSLFTITTLVLLVTHSRRRERGV
jgi:hypothetical protein